jgi:hypothetical protein
MPELNGGSYDAQRVLVDTGFRPIEIIHKNSFPTSQRTGAASVINTDWLLLFREIIGNYRRIIPNTSACILCGKMKGFLILKQKVHTISTGIEIVNVKKLYIGHAH